MAVGMRRTQYGPPPFFGADDQTAPQQYMGFLDVAGQPQELPQIPGVGDAMQMAQAAQPEMFEPIKPPEQSANLGSMAGDDQAYPSEASINRRMKLAEALMGQQQEVNHPLQAIGNAVSKISGAYLESKAQKDLDAADKRRLDAMKGALSGGGDLGALADRLLASNDPDLVEKGLNLKLSAFKASHSRMSGKPTQMIKGDQFVYVDEEGNEIPGYGGPRSTRGEGGGGDGDGYRSQKGDWVMLPNGQRVYSEFIPGRGLVYRDTDGSVKPVPQGAQPITASQGGYQNAAGWLKLKKDRQEGINALNAIDAYAKQAGGLRQGYQRWATGLSAKFKTFLGQQGLTQEEFDQLEAPMKQQALLGMLRTTIVGPGVMTEYDAERIIQAMGGDPRSAMQNPAVLASILEDLYERKRQEVQVLQSEYERNAPSFGETPEQLPRPQGFGPRQQPAAAAPQQAPLPPPEQRIVGKTERQASDGNTYVWSKDASGKVGWVRKR